MGRYDNPTVQHVNMHFLDSGSFSLRSKAIQFAEEQGCSQWDYYDTKDFWKYMDSYAAFVKKYKAAIDLYANVDVIPNAELTLRNQEYLESKGLKPVPVVHFGTSVNGVRKYMDKGYKLIALGSLVGQAKNPAAHKWLDDAFRIACTTKDHTPKVKIHGFGVTSFPLLFRYPWWSVDSTTWTKIGAYGGIIVPKKRGGKFCFDDKTFPRIIKTSIESPDIAKKDIHLVSMHKDKQIRKDVEEWLEFIGLPMGKYGKQIEVEEKKKMVKRWEVLESGVVTHHTERREANLIYFEALRKAMPRWPQPLTNTVKPLKLSKWGKNQKTISKTEVHLGKVTKPKNFKPRKIKIFYSGEAAKANPELVLKTSNLMLTYFKSCGKKPEIRFVRIHEQRVAERKKGKRR